MQSLMITLWEKSGPNSQSPIPRREILVNPLTIIMTDLLNFPKMKTLTE